MLYIGCFIIVNGQNINFFEKFPLLTCKGSKTAEADCAHTKYHTNFWGAHSSGWMGLVATTWVPIGAQVPILSPNNHPNRS